MHTRQTDVARLLMGTKVFVVPQFQRHYKWRQAQWFDIYEDILHEYHAEGSSAHGQNEGHFLGSIVLHPAPGPASTVARYWVIDGQQRLTTLMVLIAAIRDVRAAIEPSWNPNSYSDQYLVNPYNDEDRHKLVPGDNDRADFVSTVYENSPKGAIGAAYRWFRQALIRTHESEALDFKRLESAVLLRLILVELNTSAEDNINQIFHTINFAGMKLTAIDLIRNHTFMQFGRDEASRLYEAVWRPMEVELGDEKAMLRYFWAQLVRTEPKATQRDLYGPYYDLLEGLKRRQPGSDSAEIIRQQLSQWRSEVGLFKLIESPGRDVQSWTPALMKVLHDLATWGSQTYLPIALELLSRARTGRATEAEVTRGLQHLLSFYVRRGLAGIPTNNLNRILSVIPRALDDGSPVDLSILEGLSHGSKYWPTDREVRERALSTPIYLTLQTNQVKFILGQLNAALGDREAPEPAVLTIEHVMPQSPTAEWLGRIQAWGGEVELADSRTHVLGNLTLTGYNGELGRKSFDEKRAMLARSNVRLNRRIAGMESWSPRDIDTRTQELVDAALEVWQRPSAGEGSAPTEVELLPERFDASTVLSALPGDVAVPLHVLERLTGAAPDDIVATGRISGYRIESVDDGAGDLITVLITSPLPSDAQDAQRGYDLLDMDRVVEAVQAVGTAGSEPEYAD